MPKEECYHCGADCDADKLVFDEKAFCCNGCKTVYEILNLNDLESYYSIEQKPGSIPNAVEGKFSYLDQEEIAEQLLEFKDGQLSVVKFFIPTIHCSSCIWVLENLNKLNPAVRDALVNFPKKEVRLTFFNDQVNLRELAELCASIGYEPYISLEDETQKAKKVNRKLIYQLAVAGFAFGNVMMLSFPEYFEVDEFWLDRFKPFFRGLMLLMAIPSLLYSGQDYLISAYKGLSKGILNIDVPISLGILVLFFRSAFEVLTGTGQGYFDSLTGLIFFLLLGKIFQQKTYGFLSFERDYKSYFPIAVTQLDRDGQERNIAVSKIKKGDRLLIRNEEIIPVDGILIGGEGQIDYAFVTGESLPQSKRTGEKLFAGGKQTGGIITMDALESVDQSYLTQLWSKEVFQKEDKKSIKNITDSISRSFTFIILSRALISGSYWYFVDKSLAFEVVSAILIVACPCALALSAPFSLGNTIRLLGKDQLYLKDVLVIEKMARITSLVFDKTGTLTTNSGSEISFEGLELSATQGQVLLDMTRGSNHPLSRAIHDFLKSETSPFYSAQANASEKNASEANASTVNLFEGLEGYEELSGKGITAAYKGAEYRLGSAEFCGQQGPNDGGTRVFFIADKKLLGAFSFHNKYREKLKRTMESLEAGYALSIITGDNEGERENLAKYVSSDTEIKFNQKPEDKLEYIEQVQEGGAQVLMFGDGLNDAGALAQSEVGIAISENINVFSPACDGILAAENFYKIPAYLKMSQKTMWVIKGSFVISFLYNIVGLLFAVTGNLSPIVAAILMPISSISVVSFATLATNFFGKKFLS